MSDGPRADRAFDRGDIDLFYWLGALSAAAFFLLRFGYDFGISDQDEFLPYLAHLIDPTILADDWFVGVQTASFNVRTMFVLALLPLAKLLGTEAAVHVVYAASFAGVCLGIYRIGLGLHRSNAILAAAGIVLAVAVTARWNPGGNDVVASVLTPSIPAWAFALNGLALLLTERLTSSRTLLAAILISLATALQALVGLQTAALSAVVLLFHHRAGTRSVVVFLAAIAVGTLLSIVPVLVDSGMFGTSPATGATVTPVEILAVIRAPHHYLPSEFGIGRWVRLWIVAAAGIAFLWRRPDLASGHVRDRMLLLTVVLLGTLAVFRIWIFLDPLGQVVLLQPFKMTVLLRVVCAVAAVGWLHPLSRYGRQAVTAFSLPAAGLAIGLYVGALDGGRMFGFTVRGDLPVGEMHAWVRSSTPEGSVFAIPPEHTGFSWATRRAQYVNFKAVPYSDADLRQWLDRLRTVSPFEMDGVGGTRLLPRLERSYHSRHPSAWHAVLSMESIDYLVARRGDYAAWPTENASYCNEGWCVYSVDDLNSIDEWRYATD